MPRPRDQRLYFELQGKLTQQEVDYNNMHQHHTIVRAPQGKVTKISNDQYHDSMDIDEIEPIARQRTVVAQEFKLVNCNGNTRLVGSQGSTETYPSTTRTCITRLGYFPS